MEQKMLQEEKKIRTKFTIEEDEMIINHVYEHGEGSFDMLVKKMPNKTLPQIRNRWNYTLRPNINKSPYTDEENERIIQYVAINGRSFKNITTLLHGRTCVSIRNQFTKLQKEPFPKVNTQNTGISFMEHENPGSNLEDEEWNSLLWDVVHGN